MRRAWLLALAIPVLAGFECTITTTGLQAGNPCDYYWDANRSRCEGDSIVYCGEDHWVYQASCPTWCGGPASCGYSSAQGRNACICDSRVWAPGYACDWLYEYASGTCAGDTLTYCAEDNVIYDVSCHSYCVTDYGATSGSCAVMAETGYNGCNCVWDACDFPPYCYDALWQVWCDPGSGAQWQNCDERCMDDGFPKGFCDGGTGNCVCET